MSESVAVQKTRVPLKHRESLIKALPCFSMLKAEEIQELASAMTEKIYLAREIIVAENDLIDSVYIIVRGRADVTHEVTQKKKNIQFPVANLGPGEAIGLNDTGFFSATGKRTATVTAFSDVLVLMLSISDLHSFLQKYSHLPTEMLAVAEQMLRVKLIKQSLPFHRLSHERLYWLAEKVEHMSVPAGTILFKQGDEGDCCYLIRTGQIEITCKSENNEERVLAVLTPPTLFGEATLITHTPRNATARALENSELFVLPHKYLSELVESEKNVANMFMTLVVDRSRPAQNPHVTAHKRINPDGQEIIILKNTENGRYFKLSNRGQFIWQQLNGKQTMQEITLILAEKFNVFAPDVVAALISKLASAGFIENVEVSTEINLSKQPIWVRVMERTRRLLEARVTIGDADKWITKFYTRGIRFLFTSLGQTILALLAIIGIATFVATTSNVIEIFQKNSQLWWVILLLIPFTIFSTALHELGHAFATKAFGYEVHYMGVGWYWFGPVAFADTSDIWLSTRWPRIAVNLAGVYTDVVIAGISALLIFLIHNIYCQAFFWLFALFTYVSAFRMMSPFLELDGYFVLMDLLEQPQLRQRAVFWLVKEFPKALRHPSLFRKNWPEVCYWLACIVFLILVIALTVLLQTILFKMVGIHSSNPFVSLALPFFIVLLSSLSIIAELRSQS